MIEKSTMRSPVQRTRGEAEVARLTGGITFQDVFTFPDRVRHLADEMRSDIFRSSPSRSWSPRGFEVKLTGPAVVRITHLQHAAWRLDVTERAATFEYDAPDVGDLMEMLRVQTELFGKVSSRLNVDQVRSIGLKVIAIIPMADPLVDYLDRMLSIDPRPTILAASAEAPAVKPLEIAFRIAYELERGAAALQVSADSTNEVLLVDFDAACTDPFEVPDDHLAFFVSVLDHFSTRVSRFLAPVGVDQLPTLLPGREAAP